MMKLITLVFAGDSRYEFIQEDEIAKSLLETIEEVICNRRGGLLSEHIDGTKYIFNFDNLNYATMKNYEDPEIILDKDDSDHRYLKKVLMNAPWMK